MGSWRSSYMANRLFNVSFCLHGLVPFAYIRISFRPEGIPPNLWGSGHLVTIINLRMYKFIHRVELTKRCGPG
ncbi:hypothetical protein BDV29DRAFT_183717 [Aspergillus leporis]|uniref:Uncharacterized protein n=1 Tax=Aspergillus leporis TaxID=41062 RepID=A0A5N5WK65_9EURO|nr:hypothetical protein BDV29DRAFT_183717 [Aspergillus leporis]